VEEKVVRTTERIIRTTQRIALATGRAVRLGLRIAMAAGGSLLMVGGLILIHPLGQVAVGIPLFGLGFIAAFKAVFW